MRQKISMKFWMSLYQVYFFVVALLGLNAMLVLESDALDWSYIGIGSRVVLAFIIGSYFYFSIYLKSLLPKRSLFVISVMLVYLLNTLAGYLLARFGQNRFLQFVQEFSNTEFILVIALSILFYGGFIFGIVMISKKLTSAQI